MELVAFGDGVEMFKKSNHFDTLLLALHKRGVILAKCENTIHERKISKVNCGLSSLMCQVATGKMITRHYEAGLR